MGPEYIDNMLQRKGAIQTSLTTALNTRLVTGNLLKEASDYTDDERRQGVVQVISAGEKDYKISPGMIAKEGHHTILLACWLYVDDTPTKGEDIEAAEMTLIEEIKTWARGPFTTMGVRVVSAEHSKQQQAPWGWALVVLDVGPKL
ncbi:MAG: hypothetical protein HUJ30_08250 [Gammaproteobacteria bacterium]|nr:hypothetical protein [Gammaproteobacteria bacterium]